jgi:hypothetical protein
MALWFLLLKMAVMDFEILLKRTYIYMYVCFIYIRHAHMILPVVLYGCETWSLTLR